MTAEELMELIRKSQGNGRAIPMANAQAAPQTMYNSPSGTQFPVSSAALSADPPQRGGYADEYAMTPAGYDANPSLGRVPTPRPVRPQPVPFERGLAAGLNFLPLSIRLKLFQMMGQADEATRPTNLVPPNRLGTRSGRRPF